jgi:RimJ/RimL family protein N-acetyltransferase
VEVKLSTPRLLLREFRSGDAPAVLAYAGDPEVVRYLQWGPNTLPQCEEFVITACSHAQQGPEARKSYNLAVTLRSGELIGAAALHVSSLEHKQAFIGYALNRSAWGRGYGTEAAREIVRFGFSRLGMHRIYATSHVENSASEAVLRKVGMSLEGTLREHRLVRGQWRSSRLYSILAGEAVDGPRGSVES